ncbi:MAG: hypothetical protein ACE5ES_00550 [Candidatus Nanoarchaeia archaeon]
MNRRQFLIGSGLTTAGLVLLPSAAFAFGRKKTISREDLETARREIEEDLTKRQAARRIIGEERYDEIHEYGIVRFLEKYIETVKHTRGFSRMIRLAGNIRTVAEVYGVGHEEVLWKAMGINDVNLGEALASRQSRIEDHYVASNENPEQVDMGGKPEGANYGDEGVIAAYQVWGKCKAGFFERILEVDDTKLKKVPPGEERYRARLRRAFTDEGLMIYVSDQNEASVRLYAELKRSARASLPTWKRIVGAGIINEEFATIERETIAAYTGLVRYAFG